MRTTGKESWLNNSVFLFEHHIHLFLPPPTLPPWTTPVKTLIETFFPLRACTFLDFFFLDFDALLDPFEDSTSSWFLCFLRWIVSVICLIWESCSASSAIFKSMFSRSDVRSLFAASSEQPTRWMSSFRIAFCLFRNSICLFLNLWIVGINHDRWFSILSYTLALQALRMTWN